VRFRAGQGRAGASRVSFSLIITKYTPKHIWHSPPGRAPFFIEGEPSGLPFWGLDRLLFPANRTGGWVSPDAKLSVDSLTNRQSQWWTAESCRVLIASGHPRETSSLSNKQSRVCRQLFQAVDRLKTHLFHKHFVLRCGLVCLCRFYPFSCLWLLCFHCFICFVLFLYCYFLFFYRKYLLFLIVCILQQLVTPVPKGTLQITFTYLLTYLFRCVPTHIWRLECVRVHDRCSVRGEPFHL